jgi:hypothetical protein
MSSTQAIGDGEVEPYQQLVQGLALTAYKHGQDVAAFGGDGDATGGRDDSDGDLTVGLRSETSNAPLLPQALALVGEELRRENPISFRSTFRSARSHSQTNVCKYR